VNNENLLISGIYQLNSLYFQMIAATLNRLSYSLVSFEIFTQRPTSALHTRCKIRL